MCICLFLAQQPPLGRGLLTHEVSRSHYSNNAPQSVGLLWTSDQFVAEASTWQYTTLTTDKHPCPRWDSNPQYQQASGLRPRGHRDWHVCVYANRKIQICAEARCLVDIGFLIGVSEVAGSNLGQSWTSRLFSWFVSIPPCEFSLDPSNYLKTASIYITSNGVLTNHSNIPRCVS
jgi:hypothetical protein